MNLTRVDHFDCFPHVITTFQYGSHPNRVYAFCPFCRKYAILNWKDSRARWANRIFYSVPLVWQASLAFIAIAGVVYFIYLFLK